MRALLRTMIRTIRERGLVAAGDRVAVALSGGGDSVALTRLLVEAAPRLGAAVCGLIHVHHGLRGDDADRDAAFCAELAAHLALPIDIVRVATRAAANDRRISIEAAARDLRYDAFREAAQRLGATSVATAHTLDDQAETVLLRLLRGAGTRGLSAIRAKHETVIRPLIDCRRGDLRVMLGDLHQPFRDDASNRDTTITRNRLRAELLPVIERIAPGGLRAIARLAALAADDEVYLQGQAIAELPAIVLSSEDGVELDRRRLAALPPALRRRVIRWAVEQVGVRRFGAGHVEAVSALVSSKKERAERHLPGLTARRQGERVILRMAGSRPEPVAQETRLDGPGSVEVPHARLRLSATVANGSPIELASGRGDRATVAADALRWPLTVRTRRPGDRFRPLGGQGSRKLQDVLVDRKVPRGERDRVAIVTDAAGAVVWVVGVALAEAARVPSPEAKVVILEARRQD